MAWITAHKDALLVVVALAGVIVGPRTQRWIAKTTFRTNRDHQWIADFRQALAEALAFAAEYQLLPDDEAKKRQSDIGRGGELTLTKIELMVSQSDGDELRKLDGELFLHQYDDQNAPVPRAIRRSILAKARNLIEQRERRGK